MRKPLLYTFALSLLILLTASRCGAQVSPVTPNDPLFPEQWGLKRILAPEAWNIEKGNSSIIVGIVDTGVDYSHPDLKANMWTAPDATYGWDFAENDNDPMDAHGHGTQVAGVVGAVANNGIGVCGVVWNVKIMAVRVRVTMETDYTKVAQGIHMLQTTVQES